MKKKLSNVRLVLVETQTGDFCKEGTGLSTHSVELSGVSTKINPLYQQRQYSSRCQNVVFHRSHCYFLTWQCVICYCSWLQVYKLEWYRIQSAVLDYTWTIPHTQFSSNTMKHDWYFHILSFLHFAENTTNHHVTDRTVTIVEAENSFWHIKWFVC
jgi:hypothetical protein